ncbi:response regulator [Clostridium sp. FP2]|uniref:response regulator transcription factor n=1 Tax=Clostridium sp. FP2 TaxID=2724481 RepID=UPI0013E97FB3|nr:response regulator [Clostridium sp. FP2]MBZ9621877.1 response regulator [Clostridium sp. FP2]
MFEVMIVDDMEIMRRDLKRLKIWGERTGFIVVEEAKDGQEALKKLKKRKVDLVITDIKMPLMDGVDLLKNIINKELSSCVVFLSEYSEFEYARQGLVYGAFDYIIKPIDEDKIEKLLLKVAKYISEKKLKKEKLKKLEVQFEEKIETFYVAKDLEKIIKLFKDVDLNVVEVASSIVETTGVAVNYDPMKVAYILNRMTSTLIEVLQEIYPWLTKLVNISEYVNIDFTKCPDFSNSKTTFLEIIRDLITHIKKFDFGHEVNSMIRNICKVVLEHIDAEVSVKIIADQLFLNHSYLSTVYKEKTGTSLVEYITMVKMERAKILFENNSIKNYEIADKLGYKDVEYFSKLFKKYTGTTPSNFKCSRIVKKEI